jgi:putative flippase GtrA
MKKKDISREIITYLVAGVLTTLINFAAYYALIYFGTEYKIATTAAFIASVLFAFVANKKYVFLSTKGYLAEFVKFMLGRGFTYVIDLGTMILLVDFIGVSEYISKIWANILVIAANYIISKYWTFH